MFMLAKTLAQASILQDRCGEGESTEMVGAKKICPICNSKKFAPSQGLTASICSDCGFVHNPNHNSPPNLAYDPRMGTVEKAGRNYYVALMGAVILGRYNLKLGIHRPGVTQDVQRISGIPMISEVSAIEESQGVTSFSPQHAVGKKKYDIIVSNETLQTISTPSDIQSLFGDVKKDGLLIASTDLNDGSNLSNSKFLEARSSAAMWSGGSLTRMAEAAGGYIDFRVPKNSIKKNLHRKRYVMFYRSEEVERAIRLYFSTVTYGPAEV